MTPRVRIALTSSNARATDGSPHKRLAQASAGELGCDNPVRVWPISADALIARPPSLTMSAHSPMLTVTFEAIPPNASERKLLADMLRSGDADRVSAHAMVTDSALVRGVMTALDWVVKKPFKESAFADAREAVRWLATFTPELHVTEVVLAISAAVPAQVLMPSLRGAGG